MGFIGFFMWTNSIYGVISAETACLFSILSMNDVLTHTDSIENIWCGIIRNVPRIKCISEEG